MPALLEQSLYFPYSCGISKSEPYQHLCLVVLFFSNSLLKTINFSMHSLFPKLVDPLYDHYPELGCLTPLHLVLLEFILFLHLDIFLCIFTLPDSLFLFLCITQINNVS